MRACVRACPKKSLSATLQSGLDTLQFISCVLSPIHCKYNCSNPYAHVNMSKNTACMWRVGGPVLSVFVGLLNLITVWVKFSSSLITRHKRLKPHSAILAPKNIRMVLLLQGLFTAGTVKPKPWKVTSTFQQRTKH